MAKRAVAYVRVSTDSDAQLHSFEQQELYWRNELVKTNEFEFCGLYADKGISGKSTVKRLHFLRMIADAYEHKFDVVFCKSVSRFGRNAEQMLGAVHELRELGIEVRFEKENIRSLSTDSDIMLTVAAAVAEEEIKEDADRMRWSIHHRFSNGWVSMGSGIYGYRMNAENVLIPHTKEAETVRYIFKRYLEGSGLTIIKRELEAQGIPNAHGDPTWYTSVLNGMLKNEKYMGDAKQQKSVYIDGKNICNEGGKFAKQYYIENAHEGIVAKEEFYAVQAEFKKRASPKMCGKPKATYPFTGVITCGKCGAKYNHKISASSTKYSSQIWDCGNKLLHGKNGCDNSRIKESILHELFIQAYNEFVTDRPKGLEVRVLIKEIEILQIEERDAAILMSQKLLSEKMFREEQRDIKKEIRQRQEKLGVLTSRILKESDYAIITEFNQEKVEKFIAEVSIADYVVTFKFINGVEIMKQYTNGQPGNQKGWMDKNKTRRS